MRRTRNACENFATRVYRDSCLVLSLDRTTTVASHLPLHPSFSSWLATTAPTSWAGTSFLSDAISLHHTGPLSPAWQSFPYTPSRFSSPPSSFVPFTIVSSAGGRPTIESTSHLPILSRILSLTSHPPLRATRRRHGIPDTDNRPFNVAYAAAMTARKENEARKNLQLRQRTIEEASPVPSPTRKSFGLDAKQLRKRVSWHAA